jgi:hypothetical protein
MHPNRPRPRLPGASRHPFSYHPIEQTSALGDRHPIKQTSALPQSGVPVEIALTSTIIILVFKSMLLYMGWDSSTSAWRMVWLGGWGAGQVGRGGGSMPALVAGTARQKPASGDEANPYYNGSPITTQGPLCGSGRAWRAAPAPHPAVSCRRRNAHWRPTLTPCCAPPSRRTRPLPSPPIQQGPQPHLPLHLQPPLDPVLAAAQVVPLPPLVLKRPVYGLQVTNLIFYSKDA